MKLGFKPQFIPHIISGKKIHTIRRDAAGRAQEGISIYMYDSEELINNGLQEFDIKPIISMQKIEIKYTKLFAWFIAGPFVKVDDRLLTILQIHDLATADGFDNVEQFFDCFDTDFVGKIIHWTDKIY
jgi:hypothetical protein